MLRVFLLLHDYLSPANRDMLNKKFCFFFIARLKSRSRDKKASGEGSETKRNHKRNKSIMEFLMVDDHKFPVRCSLWAFSRVFFSRLPLLRWLGMLNRCHLSGGNLTQKSPRNSILCPSGAGSVFSCFCVFSVAGTERRERPRDFWL